MLKSADSLVCNALAVFAVVLISAQHAGAAEAEDSPGSKNAALMYWLAFDQLDATMADEKSANIISDYATVELDDKVKGLVEKSETLAMFHVAVALPECDWGTGPLMRIQGPALLLPHLNKTRTLARLALLRARWHLANHRGEKAVDDLVAVYALSRHVEQEPILISMLVGHAINGMANMFIADQWNRFSADDLKRLREKTAAIAPHITMKTAIAAEGRSMAAWLKNLVEGAKGKEFDEAALELLGPQAALLRAGGKEMMHGLIKDLGSFYDEMVPLFDLPRDRFFKEMDALEGRVQESKNPLVKLLMPALGVTYDVQARTQTNDLIVQAAITLRLEGRDKFDAIKDPYGEGPFALEQSADAMVIKSKLVTRKEQVMLKFVTAKLK